MSRQHDAFATQLAKTIGKRIAYARVERQYTQRALGAKIGPNGDQIINRYERGRRLPNVDLLVRLADALDVSVLWLIGRAPLEPLDGD